MWMMASAICGYRAISRSLTTCDRACASARRMSCGSQTCRSRNTWSVDAARADLVAAEHAGHAQHDALEVGLGHHDPIAQDPRGGGGDLVAGVADEAGDDQRGERIENRQPGRARRPARRSRRATSRRRPASAARRPAAPRCRAAAAARRFVATRPDVDRHRDDHDHEARRTRSSAQSGPAGEVIEGVPQDLDDDQQRGTAVTAAAATVSYLRCP